MRDNSLLLRLAWEAKSGLQLLLDGHRVPDSRRKTAEESGRSFMTFPRRCGACPAE
jgi:hypothetical protein